MKKLILILIVFTATHSFAQRAKNVFPWKSTPVTINKSRDTSLRVIIVDKEKQVPQPAYFVNDRFVQHLGFINPKQIENINVVKRDTIIGTQTYAGQIHIKTKANYTPKFISLAELKDKYTSFKDMPVVFMLDADIINSDEESFFVDENNLLTIIVDKLKTNKDNVEIGFIKLLTKSKENIDKRNNIMIRGEGIAAK
ncbi:hypothetical protein [Sphingobacterium gobiense]|uniref:Gliding motility-associated protein GldM C-terminal domain-containing protein n=1 Tax=Sphingobacterium gobiense TaxID=1382456 RepID=A0A2S9JU70_9SPHI|nr:hypothetical protein [Sphingobacterium gobiense]PRD56790.1 hypothetical protein C5749_06070 [Sphingobacterium gobiense]